MACSRYEIMNWINDTLLMNITKIQQLGTGSIYCHLLDAAYPERISLHKVKWEAKLETEFIHNFKVLQLAFEFLGVEKKIEIQKLAKAKYQDNLEFIQWFKSFLQDKIDYQTYQPLKRRNYAKISFDFLNKKKFNVTLNPKSNNKENMNNSIGNMSSNMKSSVKSNSSASSMKSSGMFSSRNSFASGECRTKKGITTVLGCKRSSFSSNDNLGKRMSFTGLSMVKSRKYFENVQIIESGDEDEIF